MNYSLLCQATGRRQARPLPDVANQPGPLLCGEVYCNQKSFCVSGGYLIDQAKCSCRVVALAAISEVIFSGLNGMGRL